jgi:hypothetical protein
MPYTFSDEPGPVPCRGCGESVPTEAKPTGWFVAFHPCQGA